jgi:hydrogenase expression/formation protein HypE
MIRMAHGSGGRETEQLVKDVFLKHFHNDALGRLEDAAVLELSGKAAFTTDSFVVTPLFFKGGDIGRLAVCGTVNDLLMMGAQPRYLSAGFIIEEGLSLETLDAVAESMARTAAEAGVSIVAGDTKVIEGHGGLYINTAGIGIIPDGRDIGAVRCAPGDAILVSGDLGDHHACILSARMNIENGIESDAAPLNRAVNALLDSGANVKAMRDVTRGGLATILNELCAASETGAGLEEAALPVLAQTAAFCEILGLDPLYMGNEGKFVAIVKGEDALRALDALRSTPEGCHAAVIGYITEGKGLTLQTKLGGRRRLGVLTGEGLPRIC